MTPRRIRLLRDSFPDRPALDTALSRALLQRVSAGRSPETFRLHRPGAVVAFGRQDVVSPGYADAVRAAEEGGFAAVERLAGGRAAVFHPGTIAFSWAIPDPSPRETVTARFEELAGLVVAALRRLGIEAAVGEVPGEYCPGRYSVSVRGERKLMGVGQRLARRAAHVGGVIVVSDSERVRRILLPVYASLGLSWDPATVGSVAEEAPGVGYHQVEAALLDELAARHHLAQDELEPQAVALAERLEPEHRPQGRRRPRSMASLATEKEKPGSVPPAIT